MENNNNQEKDIVTVDLQQQRVGDASESRLKSSKVNIKFVNIER